MATKAAVLIQPCQQEHLTAVQVLLIAAGWAGPAVPSDEAILGSLSFVAITEDSTTPVGFIRALSDGEVVSYIAELVVDAGHRDQKIGRALLDAVANAAPSARIDLLSSEMALGFYERCGFAPKSGYRRWPSR
jgi:ribosomal protein S18 acetylase RimI-like enzyme